MKIKKKTSIFSESIKIKPENPPQINSCSLYLTFMAFLGGAHIAKLRFINNEPSGSRIGKSLWITTNK